MSTGERSAGEILGELQTKGDKFTKLSVIEKKRLTDLQDAVAYISSETDSYREQAKQAAIDVMNLHVMTKNPAYSRADGVNVGKEAKQVTMKALNILEWKLNTLLQRKSEVIIGNKKLKTEIDHYRRMRLQTDDSHAKFEETLKTVKEKIENYLSESSAIVEERERFLEQKEQLERINIEEQRIFSNEYEEMGHFIKAQNTGLEEALLKERKADRKADQEKNVPPPELPPELKQSDLSLEEELEMANEIGSLNNFMVAETSSLSGVQSTIRSYEQMFEQLKKMTGTNSMEEVVSTYVAVEEEMFSLYNFIQTVNGEIDNVVESTNQMAIDIDRVKQEQETSDDQRRNILDNLTNKYQTTIQSNNDLVEQSRQLQDSLQQVNKKVQSIFFKLQCDQMESKGAQPGGNNKSSKGVTMSRPESKVAMLTGQGVTESNVLDYMGCIEQRAVDIITDYLRLMSQNDGNQGPRSPTPGPATPMLHCPEPVVELGEFSDEELLMDVANGNDKDDDLKPIDLSQFKDKLSKRLGISNANKSNKRK
jgi:hypothetical protein